MLGGLFVGTSDTLRLQMVDGGGRGQRGRRRGRQQRWVLAEEPTWLVDERRTDAAEGAAHVSLDRHSTTVTNVAEGCVYIRRRFMQFLS